MEIAVKSLSDWLEANIGKQILIRKHEQSDTDEVRLLLSGVDYRGMQSANNDGYTSDSALLLKGKGVVITKETEEQLPRDMFEIPISLNGLNSAEVKGDSVILETERAKYLINLK